MIANSGQSSQLSRISSQSSQSGKSGINAAIQLSNWLNKYQLAPANSSMFIARGITTKRRMPGWLISPKPLNTCAKPLNRLPIIVYPRVVNLKAGRIITASCQQGATITCFSVLRRAHGHAELQFADAVPGFISATATGADYPRRVGRAQCL